MPLLRPVVVADRYLLDSQLLVRRLGGRHILACSASDLRGGDGAALVLVSADCPDSTFQAALSIAATVGLLHEGWVPRERQSHPAVRLITHRHTPPEELRTRVQRVLAGAVCKSLPERAAATEPRLSPRENEVLRLVAQGLANSDIARRLDISPHTVRTHVQSLLTKLNGANRIAAVGAARQAGLLPR